MMFTASVSGINDLLHTVCNAILVSGREVTVRKKKTYELHPAIFEVSDPTDRVLLYPRRGSNPFATLFETIWVLGSPDNDISTLKKFLPRAVDYSDNGRTWRAGYPERLKSFGVSDGCGGADQEYGINQIEYVYRKLKEDPSSRQAVITIWNPMDDTFSYKELRKSLDFPCSNYLHYMIRDGKLDCLFAIRSNDAVYGMTGINFYEFTVLQEVLASLLGVGIGTFYYIVDSLHVYMEHKEKALALARTDWTDFGVSLQRFEFASSICGTWERYQSEMQWANHVISNDIPDVDSTPKNFSEMIMLCKTYLKYVDKDASAYSEFCKDMGAIRLTDLQFSCFWWFVKRWNKVGQLVNDPNNLYEILEMDSKICTS